MTWHDIITRMFSVLAHLRKRDGNHRVCSGSLRKKNPFQLPKLEVHTTYLSSSWEGSMEWGRGFRFQLPKPEVHTTYLSSVFSLGFWCHWPIPASNFKNNSLGQKFIHLDFTWQKKQLKCYYLLLIRHYKLSLLNQFLEGYSVMAAWESYLKKKFFFSFFHFSTPLKCHWPIQVSSLKSHSPASRIYSPLVTRQVLMKSSSWEGPMDWGGRFRFQLPKPEVHTTYISSSWEGPMDWGGGFRFQLPKPEVHPKLTSSEQFIKNLAILCALQASVAQIYRPNTPIGPSHGKLKYFVWTSSMVSSLLPKIELSHWKF